MPAKQVISHKIFSPCVAGVDHEYKSVHLVVVLWPDPPEAAATAQVVQANLEALVPGRKKEKVILHAKTTFYKLPPFGLLANSRAKGDGDIGCDTTMRDLDFFPPFET